MKEQLLAALLVLRKHGPYSPVYGICGNVPVGLLKHLLTCFKDLDLPALYPAPPPEGSDEDAADWFYTSDATTMWNPEHPYGAARWALLDRLIEHLEATK